VHLMQHQYETNKGSFTSGEEWTTQFVGSGPFKVEKWTPGQGMIARANRDWFLGPPKLEMLDIRFISDHTALLANLLSGEVDLVSSPGVRASEAVVARDQWVSKGEGYLKTWATRLSFLEFQYREVPGRTSALSDIRVRQALMQAIDRQAIVDTVDEGIGSTADAFVIPSDVLFPEINRGIRHYPLDPERSAALLAEAGWQRAASANMVVGPGGRTLDIEVMASTGQGQEATIIANNWKGLGINSSLNILPAARERDREYRANFTGTELNGRSISVENFHFVSAQVPRPETGYVELNRGSFSDPEIDRLQKIALTSLDAQQRKAATIAIPVRMSELAGYAPLHYQVEVFLAKNNVKGPIGNYGPQEGNSWNIFQWELA
jgi:peptide/nickel transport system substrate-binding protein